MANVHFVLDEAASLGANMGCIEDAIDKYRGYGIRLQLYYQTPAQLKKCFPNEQDQTVLANVTQVFFGVNDPSAEYVSNRLGDETIIVESGGRSSGYSSQLSDGRAGGSTHSTTTNSNWNQMARRLLKPEEIMSLDERIAITFVPGLPPIWTRLERYYERPIGSPRFPRLRTLAASIFFVTIGAYFLFMTVVLFERAIDVESVRRAEEYRSGRDGRIEETRNSRNDGTRVGTLQRPRVRTLRSRPIYPVSRTDSRDSRTGGAPTATRSGQPGDVNTAEPVAETDDVPEIQPETNP